MRRWPTLLIFVSTAITTQKVERAVEAFRAELCERVDGVADVAGGDGRLGDLQQSHVAQAGIGAPHRVDRMGIGGVGHGQSVFQYVDIGRRQTDLNLSRTVGTGGVEHDIAVALLLGVARSFALCEIRGCCQQQYGY